MKSWTGEARTARVSCPANLSVIHNYSNAADNLYFPSPLLSADLEFLRAAMVCRSPFSIELFSGSEARKREGSAVDVVKLEFQLKPYARGEGARTEIA